MPQRLRAALDALHALEYTPRDLLRDLLVSDAEFCAPERAQICVDAPALVALLLRDRTTPRAHDALTVLDGLQYSALQFVCEVLRSNDAPCSGARVALTANAARLLNLLVPDAHTPFDRILAFLSHLSVSPDRLILDLLECTRHGVLELVSDAMPQILPLLSRINEPAVTAWSLRYASQLYTAEVLKITSKDAGFHANAARAQPEQIESFDISVFASKLRNMAPNLWSLFSDLVDARGSVRRARLPARGSVTAPDTWIVASASVPRHFDLIAIADESISDEESGDEGDGAAQAPQHAEEAAADADAMAVDAPSL